MACKLDLNKAVREEKDSALPALTLGWGQFTKKAKKGQNKTAAQKGLLHSPCGRNSELNSSCRRQAIWSQAWFPRVSKPLGK